MRGFLGMGFVLLLDKSSRVPTCFIRVAKAMAMIRMARPERALTVTVPEFLLVTDSDSP